MAIVGTCKNGTPNQLPSWTSNRFDVFLERDPAGLPPYLNGARKAARLPPGDGSPTKHSSQPRDNVSRNRNTSSTRPKGSATIFEWPDRTQHLLAEAVTPAWKRGSSLTSEQMEAARAERMRQNGHGAISLEDARTWLEETGLCLFLPKRQYSGSLAPSFVEAVAGQQNTTP